MTLPLATQAAEHAPRPRAVLVASAHWYAAVTAVVGLDEDAWGLDHGTWSVMTHVSGSLSMTSYTLDCECPRTGHDHAPARDPLPDPDVPPDQTNL